MAKKTKKNELQTLDYNKWCDKALETLKSLCKEFDDNEDFRCAVERCNSLLDEMDEDVKLLIDCMSRRVITVDKDTERLGYNLFFLLGLLRKFMSRLRMPAEPTNEDVSRLINVKINVVKIKLAMYMLALYTNCIFFQKTQHIILKIFLSPKLLGIYAEYNNYLHTYIPDDVLRNEIEDDLKHFIFCTNDAEGFLAGFGIKIQDGDIEDADEYAYSNFLKLMEVENKN